MRFGDLRDSVASMTDTSREFPRHTTVKARIAGADVHAPASIQDEQADILGGLFRQAQVLAPVYDPLVLIRWYENSGALGPNVQAYVTNIDGLGHRFAPRIDLNSDASFERVRDAMWLERVSEAEEHVSLPGASLQPNANDPVHLRPSDAEVALAIEGLKIRARLEYGKLVSFFEHVSPSSSFVTLRRITRQDIEITGNGYWECLRDRQGRLARFVHVPPSYMRCTGLDVDPIIVTERVRHGLSWETIRQPRFFRRYVQAIGAKLVWFKELGDPRVVSRDTGYVYSDIAAFTKHAGQHDQPATEIAHFKIYATGEPYGQPRWIGSLLSVLGSRASEEVNYNYFDNKSVPPLALLVSGGRLAAESVATIETYIRDNLRGRENFHKILVIEAETDNDPLSPRENPVIKMERLTDAQQGDALFQKYDERNTDKVGSSFRLPRLLRGDVRDFNRGTAESSLRFADEQVFNPERTEFDSWVNRVVFSELGILLWLFRTNGPQSRDQSTGAEVISSLSKVGVITPNEGRELASDIMGCAFAPIEQDWAKQPLQLTMVELTMGDTNSSLPGVQRQPAQPFVGIAGPALPQVADTTLQDLDEAVGRLSRKSNEEDAQ